MAKNKIAMGINLRKNKNQQNAGFGKYYPEVDVKSTLSLKGFAQHLVDHGSTYGLETVEGVLKKITQCLPELLSQGVPVQLEPLGTFYPTAKSKKGVALSDMPDSKPEDLVKGIHIRFLPYSVTDEDLTSRRFMEDYCTLEFAYIIEARKVTMSNGKKRNVQDKTPYDTFMVDNFGSVPGGNDNTGGTTPPDDGPDNQPTDGD